MKKFIFLGCLTIFNFSMSYADPVPQKAVVTLYNVGASAYSVFDYITEGDASFVNQPDKVLPHDSVTININLNGQSTASLKFRDSIYSDCILNPEDLWGKCAEIKFTYSEEFGAPGIELDDNLRKANICSLATDYDNHISYAKCFTNIS